jgi:hypothetical protein
VIKYVIAHHDNVMQCDSMLLAHPKDPISECHQYFHNILHNRPLILSCKKWPVFGVFWDLKSLMGQFP